MRLREAIEQLLEDMDRVRPVVIAAMPDDMELRATTRRMIGVLEAIRQAPVVPLELYLWLAQQMAQLLDAEHGAQLKPDTNGEIPAAARQAVQEQAAERRQLLMQALQEVPAAQLQLDRSCGRIGARAEAATPLLQRARHLDQLLEQHLQHDAGLKSELQQLIAAFAPSMEAISSVLEQVGEDSPELRAARRILEQELPDDAEQARALLHQARQDILQAGSSLASASRKLNATLQEQMEKLSSLSTRLEQAESDARNDPLTGLPNRRSLAEFLKELDQAGFCFLIVDIDFFKQINDTHGHDVGDEVLQQLGMVLKESIRDTDLAARIGGEEFCVVFPGADIETGVVLADKLRGHVEASPFKTRNGPISVTVSIGVACHDKQSSHGETFKAADKALYISKQQGRNRVTPASAAPD